MDKEKLGGLGKGILNNLCSYYGLCLPPKEVDMKFISQSTPVELEMKEIEEEGEWRVLEAVLDKGTFDRKFDQFLPFTLSFELGREAVNWDNWEEWLDYFEFLHDPKCGGSGEEDREELTPYAKKYTSHVLRGSQSLFRWPKWLLAYFIEDGLGIEVDRGQVIIKIPWKHYVDHNLVNFLCKNQWIFRVRVKSNMVNRVTMCGFASVYDSNYRKALAGNELAFVPRYEEDEEKKIKLIEEAKEITQMGIYPYQYIEFNLDGKEVKEEDEKWWFSYELVWPNFSLLNSGMVLDFVDWGEDILENVVGFSLECGFEKNKFLDISQYVETISNWGILSVVGESIFGDIGWGKGMRNFSTAWNLPRMELVKMEIRVKKPLKRLHLAVLGYAHMKSGLVEAENGVKENIYCSAIGYDLKYDAMEEMENYYPLTKVSGKSFIEGYWYDGPYSILPKPKPTEEPVDQEFLEKLTQVTMEYAHTESYLGLSMCRVCKQTNGSQEHVLVNSKEIQFKYPAGLIHYYRDHNVHPSQEFKDFIMGFCL